MTNDLDELEAAPLPRDKADLLARIAVARPALEAAVAALTPDELARPGHEGWAVKDHLAHIATWERMLVAHLRDASAHTVVGLERAAYEVASLEALNDVIYRRSRDRSAGDVRLEFDAAHRDLLAFLETMTDDALQRRYWPDDPRSVIENLTGDTYRHYLEHRRWILELLAHLRET